MLGANEPVIAVVAPPGYGKTTVLAQWAERVEPPVAWVSCDPLDNDPGALWSAVLAALDAVEPISPVALGLVPARGGGIEVVHRLMRYLAHTSGPRCLVLDNVELVTSAESRAGLAEFALRLPEGWKLALASRTRLPIPTARLRANRNLWELGSGDLAMTDGEAAALLEGAGVAASRGETGTLVRATEGWPVGLYLGALAMRSGAPSPGVAFTGDDRLIADYLRSELVARLTTAQAEFMVRTSILERLSGPLCDAILEQTDSASILEELEAANLLVVPLDRNREWYRYHHLLRDYLRGELQRHEPHEMLELHGRAAGWFATHSMPEAAVAHAQAAGDVDLVAGLVLRFTQPMWATGRIETVGRWMGWLAERPPPRLGAVVASQAATVFALLGRVGEAERWAELAERLPTAGNLPDGSTVASSLHILRATRCRDGIARMRADAQAALDGLSPDNPARAGMLAFEGISFLLDGDLDEATDALVHAADTASTFRLTPLVALALSERALAEIERGNWALADELALRALAVVEAGAIEGYSTTALVTATAARCAVHRGDIASARRLARRAAALRPPQTHARPVPSVQALIQLAHAYLAFGDFSGADAVLTQAADIIRQRPDLGPLPKAVDELQARVRQVAGASTGASALTSAELRLVPVLPTHLSLPQIAEQLSVSRHTIKSQTLSIYRKLGVSSRAEAVLRIQELGLDS
jgi:LuxR family maltose regulon positive regulatory protein